MRRGAELALTATHDMNQETLTASPSESVVVELTAVVVAVTADEPRVLTVRAAVDAGRRGTLRLDALPAGPLQSVHRTLDQGLRAYVEHQTRHTLGYVEQLYTFGDRDRDRRGTTVATAARVLSIGYLGLVREAFPAGSEEAAWHDWYRYFPWEDWRHGRPVVLDLIEPKLAAWADAAESDGDRRARRERLSVTFAFADGTWNDERVLERYELLYEAGLVPEASLKAADPDALPGRHPMAGDHRRILATAIARLRGKIKYRPVVFELMPPAFTLLQLQRTVEALAGVRLHKPNFRRLVEQQGLVEETGAVTLDTGGRPARLVRFRREVLVERTAAGIGLPGSRGAFSRRRRDG
ncbi:MAG: hypothetical protein U1F14_13485 [Steroidobacteraceae bacterium]